MASQSILLSPTFAREDQPVWRIFWRSTQRILQNRLTLFGLSVMLLLVFTAIFAPVLMPDSPTALRLGQRLRPPGA
ncbi:MAG: D,D-dipeptide ABC transporter permease, partial [Chloroflexi bacterium]|nr:D,D-dipeptide ABC transporter permease [Chloroflexota bacterium]